jgi:hypothetical protein
MRVFALPLVLISIATVDVATKCTTSEEFVIKDAQVLSGTLHDPTGYAVSGLTMELRTSKRVTRRTRTNDVGQYNFGEVAPGQYRIRVRHPNGFCAPHITCRTSGLCQLSPELPINPEDTVVVE